MVTIFTIARGAKESCCGSGSGSNGFSSEMTKWFDTNYHYLVPEFCADTAFILSDTKIINEFHEAKALGLGVGPC